MTLVDFLSETPDIIKELSKYVPTPNMAILRLVHSKLRNLITVEEYSCSIDTLMAFAAFNSFDSIFKMTQEWGFTPVLSTKCAALLGRNLHLADQILLLGLEIPLELAVQKCNFPDVHVPCRSIGPHMSGYPIESTIVKLSTFPRYLLDSRLDPNILFGKNSLFIDKLSRFTDKFPITIVVYCMEILIGRQRPLQWLYVDYKENFIVIYALAQLYRIIGLLLHSKKAIEHYLYTEKEYNNILSSFYLLAFLGERDIVEENAHDIKYRIDNGDITVPVLFQNIQSPFEYMCRDIVSYNILAGASLGGHIELVRDRLSMIGDDDFSRNNVVLGNVACGESNEQNNEIFQYAKTLPATNFDKVAHILTILDREDKVITLKKDGLINDNVLINVYKQVIGAYPHCKRYVQPFRRMGVTDMRLQLFSAAASADNETVQELLDVGTVYLKQEEYDSAHESWPHLILWSKQDIDYALQWSIQRNHFVCVPVLKQAGAGSDPDEILEKVLIGTLNSADFYTTFTALQYLSNGNYSKLRLATKVLTKTIKRNMPRNFRTVIEASFYLFVLCIRSPIKGVMALSIPIKGVMALSMLRLRTVRIQWYNLRRRFYMRYKRN